MARAKFYWARIGDGEYDDDLTAPLTPAQEENARRRERHYLAQFGRHGYAGFGRAATHDRESAVPKGDAQ